MTGPASPARQGVAGPWKPVVLDLDRPLVDLALDGAERLHVTALRDGTVLGSFLMTTPFDPFPATLLRDALLRQLSGPLVHSGPDLSAIGAGAGAAPPTATVLVCTRDRPVDLQRCLASIARLGAEVSEVVVVDNGSRTPQTRDVALAAGARYVLESEPGLDRARNRGLQAAAAGVVLCTDDDVEVHPQWASRLLSCFDDPLVMAATGLVLPARLDTPSRQRFETHAGFSRGRGRRVWDGTRVAPTGAGAIGAGASMAFRTGFLHAIGGFPEELDAGMPTQSGGDTYAVYRVLLAGFRVVYDPRAMAFHHHRDDDAELHRAVRGYGTGVSSYLAHAALRDSDPHAVTAAAGWARQRMIREPLRTVLRRPGAVPLDLLAAEATGLLMAARAYPAARRIVAGRTAVLAGPQPLRPVDVHVPASATVSELPRLSVVIPSRGRRDSVTKLLRALDRQDYDDALVETVVVLDGDLDGSAKAVADLRLRRPVQVVALEPPDRRSGLGAAVARNVGAQVATGAVVLFLDDDVEPASDRVLMAHARAHTQSPDDRLAAVGPCPPRHWEAQGRHAKLVRNWWVDYVHRPAGRPLGFTDVLTGNLSCSRAGFLDVGGFRALPRREDWEFGHRLLSAGYRLRHVPEATVRHDADVDLASAVEDRVSEGAGDAMFAVAHPGVAALLPLSSWLALSGRRQAAMSGLFRPSDLRLRQAALQRSVQLLNALERAGSERAWSRLYTTTTMWAYWSGVATVLTQAELLALLLPAVAPAAPLVTVDLDAATRDPLVPPLRGGDVLVTAGAEALGRAPIGWGGLPWREDVLLGRLHLAFAERADEVRVRRRPA